jgi:hypothetical protein
MTITVVQRFSALLGAQARSFDFHGVAAFAPGLRLFGVRL